MILLRFDTEGRPVLRTPDDPRFEVLSGDEARRRYGLTAENRPVIRLRPGGVPPALRPLIPMAERYGIGDDLVREDVVEQAAIADLAALTAAYEPHEQDFDEWLGGADAASTSFSDEYVAFTCLRMAVDGASRRLEQESGKGG